MGRVHRLGQTKQVTVHSVRFAKTVDGSEGFERGERTLVRVRTLLTEALQKEIISMEHEFEASSGDGGGSGGGDAVTGEQGLL